MQGNGIGPQSPSPFQGPPLGNDGGFLFLDGPAPGWPTSPVGLIPGAVWNNGGFVAIMPYTPPFSPSGPVYLYNTPGGWLLQTGAISFPLTPPPAGSEQLWNNGGFACVA